jgi:hypothetical protein
MTAQGWRKGEPGEWNYLSTDGRFVIEHVQNEYLCDGYPAHPGCLGGLHEHWYWQLRDSQGEKIDAFDTLREAKSATLASTEGGESRG